MEFESLVFKTIYVGLLIFSMQIESNWATTLEEDLTLTFDQKVTLDEFRKIVESRLPHEYMKEDIYLIRWLRAKNFNLQQAERMLINNLGWRKQNKMDTIHEEDWEDLKREFPYHLESKTKEGKPVLYVYLASMDFRRVGLAGKRERFLRYMDKILDETCILVRETGEKYKNVSQAVFLWNMNGWNFVQHGCLQCMTVAIQFTISYDTHFTGCAEKVILAYTPAIAIAPIDITKNLLNEDTSKAVKILGTNRNEVMQGLLKDFDIDQLPPELGGTKIYKGQEDSFNLY